MRLDKLGRHFGIELYAKVETFHPTGSHKDRESEAVVDDASRKGYKGVGCASTGNAGISLAAFAFSLRLKCHVYVSDEISSERLTLLRMFHPVVHRVRGTYEEAYRISNFEIAKLGLYNANPGRCEAKIVGNSLIGVEIGRAIEPSVVICPTNNGTHLAGVWKGLNDLGQSCRMVAAVTKRSAIADSISGFHRLDALQFSKAMNASKGTAVEVTDNEIRKAAVWLAGQQIFCEPAGAAGLAALNHLRVESGSIVCSTVTGSGMKFPRLMNKIYRTLPEALPR